MPLPAHEFPDGFATWLEPLFSARQRFIERLRPVEQWVCEAVVDAFVREGTGPSCATLKTTSPFENAEVEAALQHLNERDFLVLEGDRVLALYPFSDRPCPHRVRVGAKRLYGM